MARRRSDNVLAKELGIGYYDKELITVAARESGLCEDVFEKADERAPVVYRTLLRWGTLLLWEGCLRLIMIFCLNDGLFKIQSDAIRKLAETESCVLEGVALIISSGMIRLV